MNPCDGLPYAVLDRENGEIHRGEALPEPIDEITDEFMGITDYQADSIITWRNNDNILNIWFRGCGKTWKSAWTTEFTMKYEGEKYLYFSLTDVAYLVADYVYLWATNLGAIIESETQKIYGKKMSGRKATYQKFGLVNGSRFEIHDINSTSTLVFHGWNIVFDDVISENHKEFPHLQRRTEKKWNSQYSKIRRKKFIMDNTRKFAGDYFDFMINQFEKRGKRFRKRKGTLSKKYTLCIDLKTPYVGLAYQGDIEGYRGFSKAMENEQLENDDHQIIAPWYQFEDFEAMKLDDIESFYSEILGIPMKIKGGMVNPEDLKFVKVPIFSHGILMGCTGVDSAQTEDEANDYTAITSAVMHQEQIKKEEPNYPRFTFYKADILRILARNVEVENENDPYDWITEDGVKIRRGIIETVQLHYEVHKSKYPGVPYIVAWERNNAGIALMEQALRSFRMKEEVEIRKGEWVMLTWPRHLITGNPDDAIKWSKEGKANVKLGITHKKNKVVRIYSELQFPIKNRKFENQQVWFDYGLESSLFIEQVLGFPKLKHDDGPDAAGMTKDELFKRFKKIRKPGMPRYIIKQEKKMKQAAEKFRELEQPWLKQQKQLQHKYKVRKVK